MSKKQIERLSFDRMREILALGKSIYNEYAFISPEIGMLRGNPTIFTHTIPTHSPLRFDESRFAMVKKGSIHYSVNLKDGIINADTCFFLGKGSIIELQDYTPDAEIIGFALTDFYEHFAFNKQLPSPFNGEVRDIILSLDNEKGAVLSHLFESLWKMVHESTGHKEAISGLIKSIVYYMADLSKDQSVDNQPTHDNNQRIQDNFMQLVNLHCRKEHQLPFYADKLFLSPRYLAAVIKKTSGVNAKEWIDRALITEAKVMLRHSSLRVTQISEELNFPNPSFFCKYFKRLTGQTPEAYRND